MKHTIQNIFTNVHEMSIHTVIILIIARVFIRDTSFLKGGDGRLLEVKPFYIVLRIGVGNY